MSIGGSNDVYGLTRSTEAEHNEYEASLFAKRITEIPSNLQMRADYGTSTDGQPDYIGYASKGLATSAIGWLLQKFTYDANRQCTVRQISYNSWDNRKTTAVYE